MKETFRVTLFGVGLSVGAMIVGCHAEPAPAGMGARSAGATLGALCSATEPCQMQWLCLDGQCTERPWPAQPETPSTEALWEPRHSMRQEDAPDAERVSDATVDVEVPHRGAPDTSDDALGHSLKDVTFGPDGEGDGATTDALLADPEDVLEGSQDVEGVPVDAETLSLDVDSATEPTAVDALEPASDTSPADALVDAGSDADAPVVSPPAKKVVFLVAEDSWETGVAAPTLIPEQGQGWVTRLAAPLEGTLLGIQVMMGEPFGSPSCGLYRVALWFAFGVEQFNPHPSWIAAQPIAMTSHDEPYVWLIDELPEIPEGPFLLGLIVDEPCEANQPRPSLLSDTSEGEGGTWLYSVDAGVSALVPGAVFGVSGRWILRALIEVALE
jgi:hypothetical protein